MLIHARIERTTVNGPGMRAGIWFQGCNLSCVGCWNESTHPFDYAHNVQLGEMQTWLMNLPYDVTGLTLSGGEPMQHSIDVLVIADFIQSMRPGFSLGMFTGYTERELETGRFQTLDDTGVRFQLGEPEMWQAVKNRLDFAVMGRFNASLVAIGKPLCGSTNQAIKLFSNRYSLADFRPQEVEITIGNYDGIVTSSITGFPGRELITRIKTAF